MITPLSAFPLGLKLVDSCSIGCLLFYLHFLVLILVHGEKTCQCWFGIHLFETETKMLIVMKDLSFSSPVCPCGFESSGWLQTFSFPCQSSGKGSCTGAFSAWPASTVTSEEKTWTISGLKCSLNCTFKSPQYEWSNSFFCRLFNSNIQFRMVTQQMRLMYMHFKHRPPYCEALQLPGFS